MISFLDLLLSFIPAEQICCELIIWFLCLAEDVALYRAGAANRRLRSEAKKNGETPPPRDIWNWAFLFLLGVSVVIFVVFIVKSIILMNCVKP